MPGTRDSQRSRCYRWERAAVDDEHWAPVFKRVEDAAAWAEPIWRRERGRVGLANARAPAFERPHWGQVRAFAHHDHRITLPRWARSRWVVLHELAHRLTPGAAHGPRFVGCLIGLGARWLDLDAESLMRAADSHAVKYHVRTIGVVPVHGPAWHVEQAVAAEGPMSDMEIASWLSLGCGVDINVRQVRGAALALIRAGRARWFRKKLTLMKSPVAAR